MRRSALLATWLAITAHAASWEARLEGERDSLDKGQPDWTEVMGQLAWKPERSLAILGGGRETERFDLRDREGFGGAYLPLGSDRTTLHLEGSASSTHHVLPKSMGLAELSQVVAPGWVLSGGYKASRYTAGKTETALGSIERYFGDYRIGYNIFLGRPGNGSWAPSHRLSASWYRDPLTFVTLAAGRGREVDNIPPRGLVSSEVRSAWVNGGIGFDARWGLTVAAGYERQGDFYTRRGARIGIRTLF